MDKTFFKFNRYFAFLLGAMFVLASCSDDDEPVVVENQEHIEDEVHKLDYEVNPRAFSLKFTDFIGGGDEDIRRLDSDTVRIAINGGLLEYLKIDELKEGDVLSIWEGIDTPPYIRVVKTAEKTDAGYIVSTEAGNIGDLFLSLRACMDTELFSDISDRPDRPVARALNEGALDEYVDGPEDFEQFVCEDGMIHPFMFYEAKDSAATEYHYQLAEMRYDDMVDDHINSRAFSVDKNWTLIDKQIKDINIYPTRKENGVGTGLFVEDGKVSIFADMQLFFEYNFTTSNRFWARLRGDLKAELPLHLSLAGAQLKLDKQVPVFEFTPYCVVFAIGPFPVTVVVRQGIVFRAKANLDTNFSMMVPVIYRNSFQLGPKYDNYKWGTLNSMNQHFGIDENRMEFSPSVGTSLSARTGIYYHIGAYLGSFIGPFFELGPQASISANAAVQGDELHFNSKASIGLGGYVGAEIKIWKWDLGRFEHPFSVVEYKLWDKDYRYEYKK